jgi:hypothetical protein
MLWRGHYIVRDSVEKLERRTNLVRRKTDVKFHTWWRSFFEIAESKEHEFLFFFFNAKLVRLLNEIL